MKEAKLKLPEVYIETMRHYEGVVDDDKMESARVLLSYWEENQQRIMDKKKLDYRNAHKLFIESTAGHLASVSPQTLYGRSRVGIQVIARKLDKKNSEVSYTVWGLLMRNLKKEKGLIPLGDLQARINWYYENNFPTTRTIENYVKDNGHLSEWEIMWNKMVTSAKNLLKIKGTPRNKKAIAKIVIFRDGSDEDIEL